MRIQSLLHAASLGMLGLAIWLFAETVGDPAPSEDPRAPSHQGFEAALGAIDEGRGPDRAPTPVHPDWWLQFQEVNLTGAVPPEPGPPGPPPPPPPVTRKPLDEIFLMISLVHHEATENVQTHVVLRYRPDAGVEIPAHLALWLDGASTGISPLASAVPVRSRGAEARAPSPAQEIVHRVGVGESLWAPYENILLVDVAEDARSAFFLRTGSDRDLEPEQVFKNEMDLDPDVARQLVESTRARETGEDRAVRVPPTRSAWVPVDVTTRVGERTYIGRQDHDRIRQDPQELLDQLTLRPWSGGGDHPRTGIELLHVDRDLGRRFGLRDRDVILEINGHPVRTKSQVIDRVRRSYRDGVREFRVRMLVMGRVVERTYVAPDGG